MQKARRRALALGALAMGVTGAMLAGCSTPTATPEPTVSTIPQDEVDEAMSTPTTIDFWSWLPGIQDQVDLFEAKYPAITVTLSNQGQSIAEYPKLRAAIEAGDVPDVAQVEYAYIPSFTLTDSLLDLTPYGGLDLEDQFAESTWSQVATDGGIWSVPGDLGPTGQLYREDLFERAGIDPPATWGDYAEAAETIKAETGAYITTLPGNSSSTILALLWQAGARPFAFDGDETVTIDFDSPEVKKVIDFWNDLIQRDLVATDATINDNWFQGIANDRYASWLIAAWGPVFLQGTAESTAGLWRAAELPQWDASEPASGNFGGSSFAVMADSDSAIVAAELVKFLNTDPDSTLVSATEQFQFPSLLAMQENPEFVDQKLDFYGGQKVNQVFVDISATVAKDWQWLPFNEFVSSSFKDTLGTAITNKTDLSDGLEAWKQAIVEYATQQGFTVN